MHQERMDTVSISGGSPEYCGLYGVHPKGWACPAFGKRCYKCHKIDHFAVECRTKLNRHSDVNGRFIKDQHEIKCMGDKIQTNQLHKMDGLHSNVVPKTVGHLIVNRFQKTGRFEDSLHTKRRDITKTSLGRRSGQDLDIVESTIKNRVLTEEDEKLINHQNKYSEYQVIDDTRQEIKILQQEVEKWKCNYNRLKEDVMKIQTEFRMLSRDNYSKQPEESRRKP